MINIINSFYPSMSLEEQNECMSFINKKCSEFYFLAYLKMTGGNVKDAIDFFKFDERLRALLLQYILRFENQIKTDFATEVETLTGSDSFWSNPSFFLNSAKAAKPDGRPSDFIYTRNKIRNWINMSRLSTYNGCSNFVALHACSFGSFIDLVKYIDLRFKQSFILRYTSFLPLSVRNFQTFSSYMSCVKTVRDRCAHGAYIVTKSMDRCLSPHSRLLDFNHSPDNNKDYSMLELTINYLLQYSNCKQEFRRKLKLFIERRSELLYKYSEKHAFSSQPITNLF